MLSEIPIIVLTGGPCAGKTTALATIKRYFEDLGFNVILVPEAATTVLEMGFSLREFDALERERFQKGVLKVIFGLEDTAMDLAKVKAKSIIICDRGALDGAAFCEQDGWNRVMEGKTIEELLGRYSGVIHMVTAADGAEEYYTLENNKVRNGSGAEAIVADKKLQKIWSMHHNFKIVNNYGTFADKMKNVIKEISGFVGLPKIEKKHSYSVFVNREIVGNKHTVEFGSLPGGNMLISRNYGTHISYYLKHVNSGNWETQRLIDSLEYKSLSSSIIDRKTVENIVWVENNVVFTLNKTESILEYYAEEEIQIDGIKKTFLLV